MENLSVIINSIIDDFLKSGKSRKLNLLQIFKNYSINEILFYYNHGSHVQIVLDYDDICSDNAYIADAYKNFTADGKRNYIALLKHIIDFTENYVNSDKKNKIDNIKYSKSVMLSGNIYQSLPLFDIIGATVLLLFNVKNNNMLIILGNLDITNDSQIIGIEQIYSKKLLCPYYVIDGLINNTVSINEVCNNALKVINKSCQINSSTFIAHIIH